MHSFKFPSCLFQQNSIFFIQTKLIQYYQPFKQQQAMQQNKRSRQTSKSNQLSRDPSLGSASNRDSINVRAHASILNQTLKQHKQKREHSRNSQQSINHSNTEISKSTSSPGKGSKTRKYMPSNPDALMQHALGQPSYSYQGSPARSSPSKKAKSTNNSYLKKKSLPQQDQFEDDCESAEEDRRVYEQVMQKVILTHQQQKPKLKTQGGQGESSGQSIVEVLIDRMPSRGEDFIASPNEDNYLSPVIHAQMLLNSYKSKKQQMQDSSQKDEDSMVQSEKSHLSTSIMTGKVKGASSGYSLSKPELGVAQLQKLIEGDQR